MSREIRSRRSALVTTFGVGSLFPAENVSYVMVGLHEWDEQRLASISEPRLARQLGADDLKAPPATPEDKRSPNVPVGLFPQVLSCNACGALGTPRQLRASTDQLECGVCDDHARLVPSRFVVACRAGHLDEFPYFRWIHPQLPPQNWKHSAYPTGKPERASATAHVLRLETRGRTSALSDMVLRCSCGVHRTLGDIFLPREMKAYRCTGARPWLGRQYRQEGCEAAVTTLQRGASNVWFSVTASSISIPPYSGWVHQVVRRERANIDDYTRDELRAAAQGTKDTFLEKLLRKYKDRPIPVADFASHALAVMYPKDAGAVSEEEFRFQEYRAILEGAVEEKDNQFVSEAVPVPDSAEHWIAEVRRLHRLREVRALRGFTRIYPAEADHGAGEDHSDPIASIRPEDDIARWLPATELLGEGTFIGLDPRALRRWADTSYARGRERTLRRNAEEAARARRHPAPPEPVDITKVAVHTLAHVLIDQLALEAGYPASSLRERLYAGQDMAGILIYTASTGSAGSLGGVAAMADRRRLGPALDEALERLSWCSADPVCIESTGSGADGANLAACHNCVLLPETSCEAFNIQLDRGSLFGLPGQPELGLFEFLRGA